MRTFTSIWSIIKYKTPIAVGLLFFLQLSKTLLFYLSVCLFDNRFFASLLMDVVILVKIRMTTFISSEAIKNGLTNGQS